VHGPPPYGTGDGSSELNGVQGAKFEPPRTHGNHELKLHLAASE
jgi:hypothetical protein